MKNINFTFSLLRENAKQRIKVYIETFPFPAEKLVDMCSIGPSCLLCDYRSTPYVFSYHLSHVSFLFLIRSTGCLKKDNAYGLSHHFPQRTIYVITKVHFRQKNCTRLVSRASVRLWN